MPECFFLVVDIGTESVRAALIDSLGAIVGIQSRSTDFFHLILAGLNKDLMSGGN